jgi:hypothetical protein
MLSFYLTVKYIHLSCYTIIDDCKGLNSSLKILNEDRSRGAVCCCNKCKYVPINAVYDKM